MDRLGFLQAIIGTPLAAVLLPLSGRKQFSGALAADGTVTLNFGSYFVGTLDDIRICSSSLSDKPETIHISGWDAHGLPIEETIVLHNTPVTTRQAFREAIIN